MNGYLPSGKQFRSMRYFRAGVTVFLTSFIAMKANAAVNVTELDYPSERNNGLARISLADDEREHVWKFKAGRKQISDAGLTDRWRMVPGRVSIITEGPVELFVSLDGPPNRCPFNAMFIEFGKITVNAGDPAFDRVVLVPGSRFRRLFAVPGVATRMEVKPMPEAVLANFGGDIKGEYDWLDPVWYLPEPYVGDNPPELNDIDCELTIGLSRVLDRCVMYAEVGGDVNGTFFGDGAYFVTVEEGTPIELGNALDPGMVELMDQLMGMAAGADEWQKEKSGVEPQYDFGTETVCDENGENCEEVELTEPQSWEEAMREWAEEDDEAAAEKRGTAGDTLAIQLADVKFSSDDSIDTSYEYESTDGNSNSSKRPLGGILTELANSGLGGFSLMATSPGKLGKDADVATLPLSTLVVLPGATDDAFGGIKFVWKKDTGTGDATLRVHDIDENRIFGTIDGQLRSERPYGNGYLNIDVAASFIALHGPRSCQGQY